MCTALAFDFGTRQIGIAVGQTLSGTANPLTVFKARDGIPNWDQIKQLLDEWQPDQVLVGLPLNMDGSESDFCARARKFARRLHGRFGVQVKMVDERLSTFEAKHQEQQLETNKRYKDERNYRDQPVDDLAAVIILQTWLSDPSIAKEP
ncbi:MAG: Holliday junction resolvase RuvX [Porticoccus sp.]|nr:Holliday junction resolvase RuvX [Porticoccus sp.]